MVHGAQKHVNLAVEGGRGGFGNLAGVRDVLSHYSVEKCRTEASLNIEHGSSSLRVTKLN